MKPSPKSTVTFPDCNTDEEEERHRKGVESRKNRRRGRLAVAVAVTSQKRKYSQSQKDDEHKHYEWTFSFWWRAKEQELRAMYEKAVELKDNDFFHSLRSFASHIMLLESFNTEKLRFKGDGSNVIEFILETRKNNPSLTVYDYLEVEQGTDYELDQVYACHVLRNFRKTMSFTFMLCGVGVGPNRWLEWP